LCHVEVHRLSKRSPVEFSYYRIFGGLLVLHHGFTTDEYFTGRVVHQDGDGDGTDTIAVPS
jgi:hypothetical protein